MSSKLLKTGKITEPVAVSAIYGLALNDIIREAVPYENKNFVN